jgi:hypothetical protein
MTLEPLAYGVKLICLPPGLQGTEERRRAELLTHPRNKTGDGSDGGFTEGGGGAPPGRRTNQVDPDPDAWKLSSREDLRDLQPTN